MAYSVLLHELLEFTWSKWCAIAKDDSLWQAMPRKCLNHSLYDIWSNDGLEYTYLLTILNSSLLWQVFAIWEQSTQVKDYSLS